MIELNIYWDAIAVANGKRGFAKFDPVNEDVGTWLASVMDDPDIWPVFVAPQFSDRQEQVLTLETIKFQWGVEAKIPVTWAASETEDADMVIEALPYGHVPYVDFIKGILKIVEFARCKADHISTRTFSLNSVSNARQSLHIGPMNPDEAERQDEAGIGTNAARGRAKVVKPGEATPYFYFDGRRWDADEVRKLLNENTRLQHVTQSKDETIDKLESEVAQLREDYKQLKANRARVLAQRNDANARAEKLKREIMLRMADTLPGREHYGETKPIELYTERARNRVMAVLDGQMSYEQPIGDSVYRAQKDAINAVIKEQGLDPDELHLAIAQVESGYHIVIPFRVD